MSAHTFAPSSPFPPGPSLPMPFDHGPPAGWRAPVLPRRGPSRATVMGLLVVLLAIAAAVVTYVLV